MTFARSITLAIAASLLAVTCLAQPYPSKPIRLLVPFGPGGVGDITSRAVMQKVSENVGQQIIIDNRPSAGGIVATETVAKSDPDGYTLYLMNNTNAVSAAMFKKLPYDTIRDFEMVTTIGGFSIVVLVAPESPVKTVKELIAQSKASNGKFNIGSINIGTTQFLSAELLKSMGSLDATSVPFNNTAGVLTALRGGSVQVAMEFLPPVLGQIRANTLRAVAVTSLARSPMLPNVPTLHESGLAGYEVNSWNGIAVAAKTPKAIVERLNKEIHAAVNSPLITQRFQELGVSQNLSTPDGMRKVLVDDIAKWNALIDKAKIQRQ
ncbi:MAG: tripartite tricarboxylate transporter substrate binding protein [Betaproteobacteria bacterium]|nr:tripartite tricarboxylate transporter substrate binding protein [Betaproteobacteria bacterium]